MVKGETVPPLPLRLQVETTDICNFKCKMCPREILSGMNTGSMPMHEFTVLVEAVKPYFVTLNGLGEPLIDRTIFDKLAYLHSHGITTSMPTNGSYIRGKKLTKLAEHLPDILTFSIDGATSTSFEHIRVNSSFEQVMKNYKAITDMQLQGRSRKRSAIRVLCTFQRTNLHDYRPMFKLIKSLHLLDNFSLVPVMNYEPDGESFNNVIPTEKEVKLLHEELNKACAEAVSDKERVFYQNWKIASSTWLRSNDQGAINPDKNNHACLVPWFNSYIDAKGKVFPCCELPSTEHVMGNINEQSFQEIWSGQKYKKFRHQLKRNRPKLSGCKFCPRNDDKRLSQLKNFRVLL